MAPWSRGPALLLRRPGVALALIAAVVVAALPAAAAGPFLSSGRAATLHHQVAQTCPWQVGARVTSRLYFHDPLTYLTGYSRDVFNGRLTFTRRTGIAEAAAGSVPNLGAPATTLVSEAFADDVLVPLWLVSRTDATAQVQVLDGPQGSGIWVTDEYARFARIAVGDTIQLHPQGETASGTAVRVAAIYRSLRQSPDVPYWCSMISYYRPPDSSRPSPQVALIDQASYLDIAVAQGLLTTHLIEYPLTDSNLSYDQARATVDGVRRMRGEILNGVPQAFGADVSSSTEITTRLPDFVARSDLARAGMLPAVVPITAAGVLVGLVVLAAATVFWVQRRRRELLVLAVHGAGTPALGFKAVVEALPALALGAVVGWACAWTLVRWAGPDPVLSGEAAPLAALGAAATLVAGLVVTGVVAALACRPLTDQSRRRTRGVLGRIPWEVLVLAAVPPVWQWLGDERELVSAGMAGSVMHVPGRLLVVPIMVIIGLAVLGGRLGAGYLRRRGRRRAPRAAAAFLSWRRISRRAAATALLAGATAIPIALATYGATVTDSIAATTAAEARLRIGSDVVLTLREPAPVPTSLIGQATEVLRLNGAIIGGVQADLLAVDPASFARDAYWGTHLDSESARRLLAPLSTGGGDRVTVVGAAPLPTGDQRATLAGDPVLGGDIHLLPTALLPGQQGGYPVALVPEQALNADTSRVKRQLWVRGDPNRILAAATAAGLPVADIQTATGVYLNTVWEPLTYTFDYLTALCLLTGVVTVVGLLLYLESQVPARRRAYTLLRRMGLAARAHRRALLAELAIPMAGGLLGGLAITAGITAAVGGDFKMNPGTPPGTILAVPYLPIGLTIAAAIAVAGAAALYAQRRLTGANPSEVLREAS